MLKAKLKYDPDTVTDLPCVFVLEWTCQVHMQDIPLEVCQTCIQARRLNMETNSTRQQTISRTPISQQAMPSLSVLPRHVNEARIRSLEEQLEEERKIRLEYQARVERLEGILEDLQAQLKRAS